MKQSSALKAHVLALLVLLAAVVAGAMVSTAYAQGEIRLKGSEILKHPIGPLALQYVELVHAGRIDDAMKMASTQAQAKYKKEPASEKKAINNFLKKFLPTRAALEAGIPAGGLLIIEDNRRATLNVITTEQKSGSPGNVTASSTTVAIPFVMEGGQWRIAQ